MWNILQFDHVVDLNKIAYSGQCFRMYYDYSSIKDKQSFRITSGEYSCLAHQLESDSNHILLDCSDEDLAYWRSYFNVDVDYAKISSLIQNGEDDFLKMAEEYSRGIRILKQEKFETLITFILSQRSSLSKIRHTVSCLCEVLGSDGEYSKFPEPIDIVNNKSKIVDLPMGYRAKYVIDASRRVLENGIDYYSSKQRLLEIYGVGEKIANCYLLFALNDYSSFPIDTWIDKTIQRVYKGNLTLDPSLREYAGIVQQFMFYYVKK